MDYFPLAAIRLFLLSTDGTLCQNGAPLPGAKRFLELLASVGIEYRVLTNNSSQSRFEVAHQLGAMGLATPPENVVTSGEATVRYIRERQSDARVFLVGTAALQDEFLRGQIDVVSQSPDLLVLGFDTTLTYHKLCSLCQYLRTGVELIATHADLNCRSPEGYRPDIGGVLAFLSATTNRSPDVIIGKPYRHMMDVILRDTGLAPSQIAVVGDRLSTDIAFANDNGAVSVLLLSGETRQEELKNSAVTPQFVFSGLDELADRLKRLFEE